ncbi:ComEC/Rec2 family competence protein [Lachnoclostridium phytofermentans]|uniref:DNA internalization-related competence protein ComEC/Rec2 n=1 Tax=Lachnoclostridium phytofermentans (strain ATCC 700394 / DSM 18823 / ISDg) TaxID=357809 RepID=A9KHP0_LACP7|nr:ComEC/Rec2 family competence protein [Lachnoclostridium phytofermentans]ABX42325.1 DNA internalization-related competence protein ComEC/Rec2 [Lachnoclostridium phytofermentans ISDg]
MIKRPLVWILLGFIFGNLLYRYTQDTYQQIGVMSMLITILILLFLYVKNNNDKKQNSIVIYKCRIINYYIGFFLILLLSTLLGFHIMKSELRKEVIEQELTESTEVMVQGKIYDISRTNKGMAFTIGEGVVSTKDDKNSKKYYMKEKIQVYITVEKNPDIINGVTTYKIGNSILLNGTLSPLSHARNPGQFDEYSYYKTKNISFKLYTKDVILKSDKIFPLSHIFYKCRQWLTDQMTTILPEKEAGVLSAILFGDKSMLPEDVSDLYQQGGIAHMMSVSGLHVSLLGYAIYKLLSKCRLSIQVSIFLSVVFLLFYGALTGYSVSTKRAVIMFTLSLGAIIFGKTYDILSSLSLSALIILIQQPRELVSAGFLLSYGAVLGIVLIYPKLCNFSDSISNKIMKKIIEASFLSISTQIMTLPLLAYFFYEIPLYSVLVNLLLVPFSSFLLVSSSIACILSFLSIKIARWIIGASYYILNGYEYICGINLKLPYHYILVGKIPIYQILFYYAVVFAVFASIPIIKDRKNEVNNVSAYKEQEVMNQYGKVDMREKREFKNRELKSIVFKSKKTRREEYKRSECSNQKSKKNKIIYPQFFLLILLIPLLMLWKGKELKVTCLDVSQGDGIVIERNGITCLIDCGSSDIKEVGKYRLIPFLKSKAIGAIDYAFISHSDYDHISGIYEILDSMPKLKEGNFQRNYTGKIVIRNLILPKLPIYDESYQNLISLANEKGVKIHLFSTGDELIWNGVTLRCLHPSNKYIATSNNAHSLVLCLIYGDFQGIFTGDVYQDGENAALSEIKKMRELGLIKPEERIEFLKVAHHGSNTSSAEGFLDGINPIYSVISAGKNNRYHHPHPLVCTRFQERNLPYDLTMNVGAIEIITDGFLMKKSSFIKEKYDD